MDAATFLAACRKLYPALPDHQLLAMVSCRPEHSPEEKEFDPHYKFREAVCEELVKTITPKDRHFAQYLLSQETFVHQVDDGGASDNIKLCAYLLFKLGYVEDALLIWRAKKANFDTFCSVDVQLLVGAGLAATLNYLQALGSAEANDAFEYISECVATGGFNKLDEYRKSYQKYFENLTQA